MTTENTTAGAEKFPSARAAFDVLDATEAAASAAHNEYRALHMARQYDDALEARKRLDAARDRLRAVEFRITREGWQRFMVTDD